jgi:TonB family protein
MKNYILLFILTVTLVLGQACKSKTEEVAIAQNDALAKATLVKNEKATALAVKRAAINEAKAKKEEQKRLAILEKAKVSPTYTDRTGNIVYYKAEIDPAYTGGQDELRKYLKANIKYPAAARDQGHEGTVFVDFVVDAKGKIREVVATDVIGENVDVAFKSESVRVVSAMPGWTPGRQHGKAVDVSFSIPITFQIED